jgi:hypothetical protein
LVSVARFDGNLGFVAALPLHKAAGIAADCASSTVFAVVV